MTLALPKSLGIDVENPQPGIYPGIAAAVYHAIALPSASKLKTLYAKSAAHMRWEIEHPKESDAIFTAIHTCILEPDFFPSMFAIAERCGGITGKGERCTRAGSARKRGLWYCGQHAMSFRETDDVGTVLPAADYVCAVGAANAVMAHEVAGTLIKAVPQDDRELTIVFRDERSGLLCKCRIDSLLRNAGLVVDLKSTGIAAGYAFRSQAIKLGYGIQAEFYMRACRAAGIDAGEFFFIAVEEKPPHGVVVHQVAPKCLESWTPVVDGLLEQWAACDRRDDWESYPADVAEIDIPVYRKSNEE